MDKSIFPMHAGMHQDFCRGVYVRRKRGEAVGEAKRVLLSPTKHCKFKKKISYLLVLMVA
jgi:hypothetical protein